MGLPLSLYVPPLYGELGVDLALMGIVLFVARFSDVITDPLIGMLSDKTKTRYGRRKPWLLIGAVPLMICTYWLLVPPDQPGIAYFAVTIVLIYLSVTVIQIPYYSWAAELSGNYNERSKVTAFREGFQFFGYLIATAIPLVLGQFFGIVDLREQLFFVAVVVCISVPIVTGLANSFVAEHTQATVVVERFRMREYLDGLRFMLKNGPYVRILIGFTGTVTGTAIDSVVSFFFCKHVLLAESIYALALSTMMVAGALCLPLWLRLARTLGKHRTLIAAVLWYVLWAMSMPVLYFVPEYAAAGFVILQGLKGMCLGATGAMSASMAADAVDIDTLRTGQSRTGLYFSVWGSVQKTAGAFAGFLGLTAVSLFGFDPTLTPGLTASEGGNSEVAIVGIILLYTVIPCCFYIATLPWLWNYPLTEERQARIRRRLERRWQSARLEN